MCDKHLRKFRFTEKNSLNLGLLYSHRLAFCHCRRGGQTLQLSDQAAFASKLIWPQDCDDSFLALLGNDGDFNLALFDVENRIRIVALSKNNGLLWILENVATEGRRR
jgi:hypothetical protein